jgi:hypothetical protein
MSVAPTEPLGDGAAELALEFNEISSVLWTVFVSSSHCYSCTFSANELLFFEIVVVIDSIALFHATEVRVLAFEALVVRQLLQSKRLEIVVESIALFL